MSDFLDLRFFGSALVTLVVIIDPPGAVPVFLGLVAGRSPRERARLALQATLTSFLLIVTFAVLGEQVLSYLRISLPSLQAAGGLLLLLLALRLLTGSSQKTEEEENVNVAMVPLGTPILAGPGGIVATMVFARQAGGESPRLVALALAVVAVHALVWAALRFSSSLLRFFGDTGISTITRVVGLLLAAIGVQLVADAVFGFIAGA